MAVIAAARKSRLRNALEGFALTTILQSFPTFAAAALLLKQMRQYCTPELGGITR